MSPKEAARTVHLAGFLVTFPSGSSLPSSVPSLRGLRSATGSGSLRSPTPYATLRTNGERNGSSGGTVEAGAKRVRRRNRP